MRGTWALSGVLITACGRIGFERGGDRLDGSSLGDSLDASEALVLVSDDFERTNAGEWGSAPIGGMWEVYNPDGAAIDVTGGGGRIGGLRDQGYADLGAPPGARDVSVRATIAFAILPTTGVYSLRLSARVSAASTAYALRIRVGAGGACDGDIYRAIMGTELVLASNPALLPSLGVGEVLGVSLRATGENPTQLCARVWRAAIETEPQACTLSATEASPELVVPGRSYVALFVSGSPPATMVVDEFRYYQVGLQ